MSENCCMFSGENLIATINESGILSPYLWLLGNTVVQMEIHITPKLNCCFRVSQNIKIQKKKIVSLASQLQFDYKN